MTFRHCMMTLATALVLAGSARASSIVVLPPPVSAAPSPSIVQRGEPRTSFIAAAMPAAPAQRDEAGEEIITLGRSIVAIGADALPDADDSVAARDDQRRHARPPLVIRGGEVGGPSGAMPMPSAPASAPPAPTPATASQQPRDPGSRPQQRAPASPAAAPAAPQPLPPTAIPM